MTKGTLIAYRGVGNKLASKGVDDFSDMMAGRGWLTFVGNFYEGAKALKFLLSQDCPRPIVFMGHSMGVDTIDDLAEVWGEPIDLFVSIGSAWPETVPQNVKRVLSIDAQKNGRFHVKGGKENQTVIIPGTTHTNVDDAQALHVLVRNKMESLIVNEQSSIPANLPAVHAASLHTSILKDYEGAWQSFMDPTNETPQQKAWQEAFFQGVRGSILKPFRQSQVDGLKTMVFIWRLFYSANPIAFFASVAGQSVRETGGRMVAVRETFADSNAQAVARLEDAWAKGQLQEVGVKKPYWRNDGFGNAFGRGIIQLSLDAGYRKAETMIFNTLGIRVALQTDYSLALDPLVSAIVAFGGCIHGTFRTTKLADYLGADGSFDFYKARSVVNGDRHLVGREIEQDSKSFLSALEAAERAAPGWLAKGFENDVPAPVEPDQIELTLAAMRQAASPDLRTAITNAADLIKLATMVLDERDNDETGFPVSKTKAVNTAKPKEVLDMNEKKGFLASGTVQGTLFALLGTILPILVPLLGFEVQPNDGQDVVDNVGKLMAGFGGIYAIFRRIIATKRIGFTD